MITSAERQYRRDLAAIYAEAAKRGIDEDTRRDIISRASEGRTRSAKDLSAAERAAVIVALRGRGERATRKPATAPAVSALTAKAQALWLALHHLGETEAATDRALAAFTRRQTGVNAPAWLTPEQGNQLIEGLRAWCVRAGFAPPQTDGSQASIEAAKRALVRALWGRLHTIGAVQRADADALDAWCQRIAGHKTSVSLLTLAELDQAAARLADWLRTEMAARGLRPPLSAALGKGLEAGQ